MVKDQSKMSEETSSIHQDGTKWILKYSTTTIMSSIMEVGFILLFVFTVVPSTCTVSSFATENSPPRRPNNNNNNIQNLAQQLSEGKFTNIVVLVGAGMSVSAGIPDFRTPGTGLYSQLSDYNLPYPEAIFELSYYQKNPKPFATIAKAIWPGQKNGPKPTISHSFLTVLDQRGLLRRVYTQNIDNLERLAGVSTEKLIECHGSFATASCISPSCPAPKNDMNLSKLCQESYMDGKIIMNCPTCNSLVKPDIVFFGEELPSIFSNNIDNDTTKCDLLIVIGTSLLVDPVARIPNWVSSKIPRLLINRDLVGSFAQDSLKGQKQRQSFQNSSRDIFLQGDCDDGVQTLCNMIGEDWAIQLNKIHTNNQKR